MAAIVITLPKAEAAALRTVADLGERGLHAIGAIADTTAARTAIGKIRDTRAQNPLQLTPTEAAALLRVAGAGIALGTEYLLIESASAELAQAALDRIRSSRGAR